MMDSITIMVQTKNEKLITPIRIGGVDIKMIGMYNIDGCKYWIIRDDRYCESCGQGLPTEGREKS